MKIGYISAADRKRRTRQKGTERFQYIERRLCGVTSIEIELPDSPFGSKQSATFPAVSLSGLVDRNKLVFKAHHDYGNVGEIAFVN